MSLQSWFYRKSNDLVLRLSQERVIHGLRVVLTTDADGEDETLAFDRVEGALGLLATHDPRRLNRMRGDLELIWLRRHPMCRGSYDPWLGACVIDLPNFVVNPQFTLAEIAASIVHEAMHARLRGRGIEYDDANGARIEHICRKAEIAFAKRLPEGAEPVLDRARQMLTAMDRGQSAAVSTAELAEMQRRQEEVRLQHAVMPRWMKSILSRRR